MATNNNPKKTPRKTNGNAKPAPQKTPRTSKAAMDKANAKADLTPLTDEQKAAQKAEREAKAAEAKRQADEAKRRSDLLEALGFARDDTSPEALQALADVEAEGVEASMLIAQVDSEAKDKLETYAEIGRHLVAIRDRLKADSKTGKPSRKVFGFVIQRTIPEIGRLDAALRTHCAWLAENREALIDFYGIDRTSNRPMSLMPYGHPKTLRADYERKQAAKLAEAAENGDKEAKAALREARLATEKREKKAEADRLALIGPHVSRLAKAVRDVFAGDEAGEVVADALEAMLEAKANPSWRDVIDTAAQRIEDVADSVTPPDSASGEASGDLLGDFLSRPNGDDKPEDGDDDAGDKPE